MRSLPVDNRVLPLLHMPSLLVREDIERFALSIPLHYGGIQSLLENMCLMTTSIISYLSYHREKRKTHGVKSTSASSNTPTRHPVCHVLNQGPFPWLSFPWGQ